MLGPQVRRGRQGLKGCKGHRENKAKKETKVMSVHKDCRASRD
jgi:hypothetical protein